MDFSLEFTGKFAKIITKEVKLVKNYDAILNIDNVSFLSGYFRKFGWENYRDGWVFFLVVCELPPHLKKIFLRKYQKISSKIIVFSVILVSNRTIISSVKFNWNIKKEIRRKSRNENDKKKILMKENFWLSENSKEKRKLKKIVCFWRFIILWVI